MFTVRMLMKNGENWYGVTEAAFDTENDALNHIAAEYDKITTAYNIPPDCRWYLNGCLFWLC